MSSMNDLRAHSYVADLTDALSCMNLQLNGLTAHLTEQMVAFVRREMRQQIDRLVLQQRLTQTYPEFTDIRQQSYRAAWMAYDTLRLEPQVDHHGLIEDPSLTMALAHPDTYVMVEVNLILFEQAILRGREPADV